MDVNRFHDQAVTALGRNSGDWHCMACWSLASNLTSAEHARWLRPLAHALQASSGLEVRRGGTCDRCRKRIAKDLLIREPSRRPVVTLP